MFVLFEFVGLSRTHDRHQCPGTCLLNDVRSVHERGRGQVAQPSPKLCWDTVFDLQFAVFRPPPKKYHVAFSCEPCKESDAAVARSCLVSNAQPLCWHSVMNIAALSKRTIPHACKCIRSGPAFPQRSGRRSSRQANKRKNHLCLQMLRSHSLPTH